MGMAASQARYLALTARKTNVEYEGQQINQSRLMLANKTADLFNQMLGLTVPTAPSSADFSILQYSFNDGVNDSVLDKYYQLGTPEEDYNYVVSFFHYTNIYKGSRKQMVDPQVQALKLDKYSFDSTTDQKEITIRSLQTPEQNGNSTYIITDSNRIMYVFRPINNTNTNERNALNSITGENYLVDNFSYDTTDDKYIYTEINQLGTEDLTGFTASGDDFTNDGYTYSKIDLSTIDNNSQEYKNLLSVYGSNFENDVINAKKGTPISNTYYKGTKTGEETINYAQNITETGTISVNKISNKSTEYTLVDTTQAAQKEALMEVFGTDFDQHDKYYVYTNNGYNYYISANEIANGKNSVDHKTNTVTVSNSTGEYYTDDNGNFVPKYELQAITIGSTLKIQHPRYTPTFADYTAVGNCRLTLLTTDDFKSKALQTEIQQIIKDMKGLEGNTVSAENLSKCFDSEGNYLGGIYTFKMGETTYYTTEADLKFSVSSAYSDKSLADNGIDGQQGKLSYYNGIYVKEKVVETKKALLQTDGSGRFSTIRFEDDSVVYTLNVENIIDDAAYNDAMNKYYYDQDVYDKAVSDINAKTKILQAQDRELELRLESLNTEQSALQNEMEAVKKVVDKHVEQGFKTFGG